MQAFLDWERKNALKPLKDGPFAKLFRAIAVIQSEGPPNIIRTAIVTARNSPAHERVIRTLRVWGVQVNEAFFMGGIAKDKVLQAFGAHIFFDDKAANVETASKVVPSARVPYKKPKPKRTASGKARSQSRLARGRPGGK